MGNASALAQIEFIKSLLRKGGKRNDIMGKFGKKWGNVSRTTFDRRLEIAKEAIVDEQKQIIEQANTNVAKKVEAIELDIMSAIERKHILTQIARGQIPLKKPMVVDKVIQEVEVVPDWMDRKLAIAELNKMDGEYAPIKNSSVNPDGTPIEPIKEQTIIVYKELPPMKKLES